LTWIHWTLAILFGALIGSFLNVVIYRGPSMWGLLGENEGDRGTLLAPRSYCPSCGHAIPSWRLIPVVSFALQGGRCAACGSKISLRYPLVELAAMLTAVVAYGLYALSVSAVLLALFGWGLIALAAIDWETGYLPDGLTLPLVAMGLLANIDGRFAPITDALIGAGAGYVAFRAIAFAFHRLRNYEGLGQGDAKLLAAIGAWGGWMILPGVVLAASIMTLLAVGLSRLWGRSVHVKMEIPFGPGLCAAGFGALVVAPLLAHAP